MNSTAELDMFTGDHTDVGLTSEPPWNLTLCLLCTEADTSSVGGPPAGGRVYPVSLAERVTRALVLYVGPVFMLLGTAGNGLAALVLLTSASFRRRATGLYLTVLAVVDTALLDLGMTLYILDLKHIYPEASSTISCKLKNFVLTLLYEYDAWVLVNLNIERLLAVYLPLKAKLIFTRKRAAVGLVITALGIIGINLVYIWAHDLMYDDSTGMLACNIRPEYKSLFHKWYWVDFAFTSGLPFLVMLCCSLAIVARIIYSNWKRSEMQAHSGGVKVSSMTISLLAVSFTFLVLSAPVCVLPLLPVTSLAVWLRLGQAVALADFIAFLNYVINFYIYCISNRNFRAEVLALFGVKVKVRSNVLLDSTRVTSMSVTRDSQSEAMPQV